MMEADESTSDTASSDSRGGSANQLLGAISEAIFDRIGPIAAGTLKQSGTAELAPIDEVFMWLRIPEGDLCLHAMGLQERVGANTVPGDRWRPSKYSED